MRLLACVMNVISFQAAYCLFPRGTLEERISLMSSSTRGVRQDQEEALQKYSARHFRLTTSVPPNDFLRSKPLFPLGWRWIDDDSSWVIPLNTSGIVETSSTTTHGSIQRSMHDPVVLTNWNMRCNSRTHGAVMLLGVIKSDFLRHRYLITDQDLVAHIGNFLMAKYTTINMSRDRGQEHAM